MKNPAHYSIAEFKQGDTKAFEAIYAAHYGPLYYFVKRIINERPEAEDIVAETFVKLWNLRANFETPNNIKAFLFITARNACLDYLRMAQRQNTHQQAFQYISLQDAEFTVVHDDIKADLLGQVYTEIENLPPKCRQVFKLAYMDGLKNEEIARLLSLSYQTVKNQKLRASKILRLALSKNLILLLLLIFFLVR